MASSLCIEQPMVLSLVVMIGFPKDSWIIDTLGLPHKYVNELFLVINYNLTKHVVSSNLMVIIVSTKWAYRSRDGKMNTVYGTMNIRRIIKALKSNHDCLQFWSKRPWNQVLADNVDWCYDFLKNMGDCGSTYGKKLTNY